MRGGLQVQLTEKFVRDYKALPVDIRVQVDACIEDIARDPLPAGRRPHSVTPKGHRPVIFTMDVSGNKAHKLSFQIEGNVAMLRRVGTHKQLDRNP